MGRWYHTGNLAKGTFRILEKEQQATLAAGFMFIFRGNRESGDSGVGLFIAKIAVAVQGQRK